MLYQLSYAHHCTVSRMLRKFPASCNRSRATKSSVSSLNLLLRRRHYKLLDHRNGQRTLVEHKVVELQHVEILSGSGLIFLAEREPFAKSHIVGWQLRRAELCAH